MRTHASLPESMRDASAFGVGTVVGVLGGLIGLGGAEFRLPVLVGWYRFPLLPAIVINLFLSLVTAVVSLAFRMQLQGAAPLLDQWSVALNLLAGSLIGSYAGVQFATRFSGRTLSAVVAVVLALLGLLLIAHGWLFSQQPPAIPPFVQVALGFLAGLVIGTVSSLLGVAGGELLIPTLVLLFGLGIKLAGSVSLVVSVPTLIVGVLRYRRRPVFREARLEHRLIFFMGIGSVLGSWVGSRLLPFAPSALLQVLLGALLLISAWKMARTRPHPRARNQG